MLREKPGVLGLERNLSEGLEGHYPSALGAGREPRVGAHQERAPSAAGHAPSPPGAAPARKAAAHSPAGGRQRRGVTVTVAEAFKLWDRRMEQEPGLASLIG
ncbi:hypothetical protein PAL_GLEAN10021046 [Pteropus alecto]|uniref:Uncharacterized protein n=1 Tax=Pteropus alecto TaxID=9402 RepID=L5K945_PTEAL|nr:hypothetical protein PAL_GLEAN10021046 [Pteropus alecto]